MTESTISEISIRIDAAVGDYDLIGLIGKQARLHKDLAAVLRMPEVRDPLVADTIEPSPSESPKAFLAFYNSEAAKWGALVKETGAKPE